MNKLYSVSIFGVLIFGGITLMSSQSNGTIEAFNKNAFHQKFTGGAQAGKSGAPGDANCTQCHGGSVLTGGTTLSLSSGLTYIPGATSTVNISNSNSGTKNGFQAVVLNSSDANVGTIVVTDATNTNTVVGSGRTYINHTSNGTAESAYTFDWTAPSSGGGDVTFYVAYNASNANGQNSGDAIYITQHTFSEQGAAISENDLNDNFSVGYMSLENSLIVKFEGQDNAPATINVIDLSGKSVFFDNLSNTVEGESEEKVVLDKTLKSGIYIVQLFVNNTGYSQKIFID